MHFIGVINNLKEANIYWESSKRQVLYTFYSFQSSKHFGKADIIIIIAVMQMKEPIIQEIQGLVQSSTAAEK